ncbi:MAG: tyrosine-type recombinase/integrase [Methanosarcinales archaeon]|nr:tyrosine-type recombinase/integrase [Methanosarcinales archaeon]
MNPFEDYISELEMLGRKPSYIRSIRGSVNGFCAAIGCDTIDPVQITERDIKAWIHVMRSRNLSDASLYENVGDLHRFFNFMIESPDHDGVTVNPCARIFKRLSRGRQQTRRPFKTVDDVGRMIRTAFNPRDRALLTLIAKLGLRRGEVTGLDVVDVNLDDRMLTVKQHADHGAIMLPGRKNGVESTLPLDDETVKVLKVWLAVRQPVDGALFVSRNGLRLDNVTMWKIVKDHAAKAGLMTNGDNITVHYFRAWCTYQLTINGCKPEIVQVIRGDVANTMANFYTREILSFDDVRREYLKAVPVFGI